MSNATPAQRSDVTVYGRLIVDGSPVSGVNMLTSWHYKTTNPTCEGIADNTGAAKCTRDIGGATSGFTVKIDVVFTYNGRSYKGETSFTPQ